VPDLEVPPVPRNESQRIDTLRSLSILDTPPEERFDRLTRLAKRLFGVPIAQVTLVDADRQWFKSGAEPGNTESPRRVSFCAHAILSDDVLLIPDAREDKRFFDNPLVTGDPRIRFYAGCPLKVDGHNLGTLCVIDDKPRVFTEEEQELLADLGEMACRELAAIQSANTDHLTGLSNRRGFYGLAGHALAFCRRTKYPATMIYFDLDKFKQINDVHGHYAGDQALKLFSHALTSVFRESDLIARLGGDEFAALMMGMTLDVVNAGLDRLKQWIATHHEVSLPFTISFSAGCTEFDAGRHESVEVLLREADASMYAKKSGRGAPGQA
jgi:diguanylate cyclase (GGDEF)-like protein